MANLYPQWLNILKWSLSQSDGTTSSDAKPMDEKDQKWLAEVLRSCVKDEPSRMLEIVNEFISLQKQGLCDSMSSNICSLLFELRDIVEQIDMANIFVKYGGVTSLLNFIPAENLAKEPRAKAAAVIGTLAQNNPETQQKLVEQGVIEKLIHYYETISASDIRSKIFFAVASIIRGHNAAETVFYNYINNNQRFLISTLDSNDPLESRRAVSLISYLVTSEYTTSDRIKFLLPFVFPTHFSYLLSSDWDLVTATLVLLDGCTSNSTGLSFMKPFTNILTNIESEWQQLIDQSTKTSSRNFDMVTETYDVERLRAIIDRILFYEGILMHTVSLTIS